MRSYAGTPDLTATSLNLLPPIFEAARQCDGTRFAELLKTNISFLNKTLGQVQSDLLIMQDEPVKFKNYTLLDFAAENGCTNIVQQLLDLGADVEPRSIVLPLSLAASNGHLEVMKMLLKSGAKPKDGVKAAVQNGQVKALKTLIVTIQQACQAGWR